MFSDSEKFWLASIAAVIAIGFMIALVTLGLQFEKRRSQKKKNPMRTCTSASYSGSEQDLPSLQRYKPFSARTTLLNRMIAAEKNRDLEEVCLNSTANRLDTDECHCIAA